MNNIKNFCMKKRIIYILVMFVITSCGMRDPKKQTEETNSDEKTDIINNRTVITDEMFSTPPTQLSEMAAPLDVDIRSAAYFWIKAIKEFNYTLYSRARIRKDYPAFFIPYGIFNLADYMDESINASGNKDYRSCLDKGMLPVEAVKCYLKSFREKLMYRIYASQELQEITYAWLRPEWEKALTEMDSERKDILREIIEHCISYTNNYNYQKELNFFNQYQWDREYLFTTTYDIINGEPDYEKGITKPYRKAEAWIFRRVHQNHMTANEINVWLKRIKKDLRLEII